MQVHQQEARVGGQTPALRFRLENKQQGLSRWDQEKSLGVAQVGAERKEPEKAEGQGEDQAACSK